MGVPSESDFHLMGQLVSQGVPHPVDQFGLNDDTWRDLDGQRVTTQMVRHVGQPDEGRRQCQIEWCRSSGASVPHPLGNVLADVGDDRVSTDLDDLIRSIRRESDELRSQEKAARQ